MWQPKSFVSRGAVSPWAYGEKTMVFSEGVCLGSALDRYTEATRRKNVFMGQWRDRCLEDGGRRWRRKCRLVWRSDAMPRNAADILAAWWETRDGWTDRGRESGREVEGQPQPHVKCGTDIWTAPSLLLLFHSVHNLTSVRCTCNLAVSLYLMPPSHLSITLSSSSY